MKRLEIDFDWNKSMTIKTEPWKSYWGNMWVTVIIKWPDGYTTDFGFAWFSHNAVLFPQQFWSKIRELLEGTTFFDGIRLEERW